MNKANIFDLKINLNLNYLFQTGGNVEARVVLYHRRRDISNALLKIADQADRKFDECELQREIG